MVIGLLRCIVIFSIFSSISSLTHAQGEGNVWAFGHHNGLNFNQSPPEFIQTNNYTLESSAAISDAAGNLLFYTDGNTVWTTDGSVMPNGTGLIGNGGWMDIPGSCTQGVTIVKSLINTQQYYVFTLNAAEEVSVNTPGYLRYSVVDMSLNNGNGDVLTDQKNIVIDTGTTEKLAVTPGLSCSYWLVVHSATSPEYRAFKIDANGINTTPVISMGNWQGDMGGGQMKISSDGNWIASISTFMGSELELANFDKATGQISNFVSIPPPISGNIGYGIAFSPDNTKLYSGTLSAIAQFDLNLMPNVQDVINSMYSYQPFLQYSSMRNGPDGKIYIALYQNTPNIACINNPNEPGAASNFDPYALNQPTYAQITSLAGNPYGHGLGTDIVVLPGGDTLPNLAYDTAVCGPEVSLSASAGFESYVWDDGSTGPTRTVTESGTYYVFLLEACGVSVDSFYVNLMDFQVDLGPDTFICTDDSILLQAPLIDGANYLWQDGSTGSSFLATSGSYYVAVSLNGCLQQDTILISQVDPTLSILQSDTSICHGDVVQLRAVANPPGDFYWSNGNSGSDIEVSEPGSYTVTVHNACGNFTDSFALTTFDCHCKIMLPTAFSPNHDGQNDMFTPILACIHTEYRLAVFNRWGQKVFESTTASKGWDGTFHGQAAEMDTYFYYLKLKNVLGEEVMRKGDVILVR